MMLLTLLVSSALFLGLTSADDVVPVASRAYFYRIYVHLERFENNFGWRYDKLPCDDISPCDTTVYVYVDLEKPLAAWPGPIKAATEMTSAGWQKDTNSYDINFNITRDVCGKPLSLVNTRVEVKDYDVATQDDLIEQFACLFAPELSDEQPSTEWSTLQQCRGTYLGGKAKQFFRWKASLIRPEECGR